MLFIHLREFDSKYTNIYSFTKHRLNSDNNKVCNFFLFI